MKSTQLELLPSDPIFSEPVTIWLRPGIRPPARQCLEAWVADTFGYLGVSFGPGGPHNSNIYRIDDYRASCIPPRGVK